MNNEAPRAAQLFAHDAPTPAQEAGLLEFLKKTYGQEFTLQFVPTDDAPGGFRLQVGTEVYDWSAKGRLRQFQAALSACAAPADRIIPLLKETAAEFRARPVAQEIGTVQTVGDGIALISGLDHAAYGEILLFESGLKGMVQNLREDGVGCILFGDDRLVRAGSAVYRTQKTAGVPVGEELLGRVVNALGEPLDGKGDLHATRYYPVERPAPGILDRQPVNAPLQTGILTIDAMFPIGRGQRELIIGDRQTGKTSIALDTILNQKGKDVVCIYVAIGQKASSVAQLADTLRKKDAMGYTIIVCATAADSAPMQYLAPYAGCAMGEYFMEQGRDVLIVYDDLSKHAVAYRTMSLLLARAPGREAFPGDVFYLHSRLLERAAHLCDEKGGGSMTALPIVQTQAGDVSAYIPTNIISITDGQLFLESALFFAGQRPAVNVGLSVSRVGGNAQTGAMKSAVGSLRLELAQYHEMKVFTQFSGDLDETTRRTLRYGQGLMALLRQDCGQPYSQTEEVLCLTVALARLTERLEESDIKPFFASFLREFQAARADVCERIARGERLCAEDRDTILCAAETMLAARGA